MVELSARRCPYCGSRSKVIDTRDRGERVVRYRVCLNDCSCGGAVGDDLVCSSCGAAVKKCGVRFATAEVYFDQVVDYRGEGMVGKLVLMGEG